MKYIKNVYYSIGTKGNRVSKNIFLDHVKKIEVVINNELTNELKNVLSASQDISVSN